MSDVWTKSRRAMSDEDYETWIEGGVSPTLNAFDNATETRATVVATTPTAVRRLTPVEVSRLQGFPDSWNDGLPDSARYKQMGNAVTVNVSNYIAHLVDAALVRAL